MSKTTEIVGHIAGLATKTILTVIGFVFVVAVFGFAGVLANGVLDALRIVHIDFALAASGLAALGYIWKESK